MFDIGSLATVDHECGSIEVREATRRDTVPPAGTRAGRDPDTRINIQIYVTINVP